MGRESDEIISSNFRDLKTSAQGHLPSIIVSVRDSTIVNIGHLLKLEGRGSDAICS